MNESTPPAANDRKEGKECAICGHPVEDHGESTSCMGIQTYALSNYPGEFRLVEAHPNNEGEQWYKRSEIDPILSRGIPAPSVSASELLPCPHCGKQAYINRSHDPDNYMFLQCSGCNACMHRSLVEGEEAAVKNLTERWNQRSMEACHMTIEEIAREVLAKCKPNFDSLDLSRAIAALAPLQVVHTVFATAVRKALRIEQPCQLVEMIDVIISRMAEIDSREQIWQKACKDADELRDGIAELQAELEQANERADANALDHAKACDERDELRARLATAEAALEAARDQVWLLHCKLYPDSPFTREQLEEALFGK